MARTESTMLDLGTSAPDFSLKDTTGELISLSCFKGAKALLVIFMCNHCPYVVHLRAAFVKLANEYASKGLAVVGINSNDTEKYPADSYAKMIEEKAAAGYPFHYLFDDSQNVAKQYQAACTPDFLLFNDKQKLVYRGQWDDSRPRNDMPVTGKDIKAAINATLEGQVCAKQQIPSMGCNIKWKEGNEPDYFN